MSALHKQKFGFGIVALQIDDKLILTYEVFAEKEAETLTSTAKPRETLSTEHPLNFNGSVIRLVKDGLLVTQDNQCCYGQRPWWLAGRLTRGEDK